MVVAAAWVLLSSAAIRPELGQFLLRNGIWSQMMLLMRWVCAAILARGVRLRLVLVLVLLLLILVVLGDLARVANVIVWIPAF